MNIFSVIIVFKLILSFTHGFYVPGIAPKEFAEGDLIGKSDDDDNFFSPSCMFLFFNKIKR